MSSHAPALPWRLSTCRSAAICFPAALCLLLGSAFAQTAAAVLPRFSLQQWTVAEGLPQGSVADIVKADDGFLYVATLGGLCRFDGDRLEVFNPVRTPGMPSNRIWSLQQTADGKIWFGTRDRGLGWFRAGQSAASSLVPEGAVFALANDAKGRLVIGSSRGLLRMDGNKLTSLKTDMSPANALMTSGSGDVYAACQTGLVRIRDDEVEVVDRVRATALVEHVGALLVGGHGTVARMVDGVRQPLQIKLPQARVRCLLRTADGALWIAAGKAVARLSAAQLQQALAGDAVVPQTGFGLPDEQIMSLCAGREGGLWVGLERSGLARLSSAELRSVAGMSAAGGRVSTVLVTDDDTLLFTTPQGAWRRRGEQIEALDAGKARAHFMLLDSTGVAWAVVGGKTLCRLQGDRLVPFPFDEKGPKFGALRTMVELPDGRFWILGRDAIVELDDDQVSRVGAYDGADIGAMTRGVVAADGAIWTAGPLSITRLSADRESLRIWRRGEELPVGDVCSLLPEAGLNAWAASYGGGLVRIDEGEVRAVDERHGLVDQAICGMARIGDQFIVAANRGCFVVDVDAAAAVASGATATLGSRLLRYDGPGIPECNGGRQLAIAVSGERALICGVPGLNEFRLSWMTPMRRELTPYVRSMFVGDQQVVAGQTEIEPGARTLTMQLGTCAFEGNDRVRFRWRVAGAADWSTTGSGREIRVDQLPAGPVVIEAETVDLDGTRSVQPLRVALALPPRLWETTGFAITATLALVVLIWLLVHAFSTHARRRAHRLRAVVAERTKDLVDVRDRLEERVAERTAELTAALDRTESEMENRQRLEREVQDLRRAETIGKLAGGVAHDFNNLLTITLGSGELLERELESESALELVRNIVMASTRGRSLTQHLLAVASRQVVTAAPLELPNVTEELMPVLRTLVGEDITITLTAPESAVVRAAITQIEQILINLVANARDAIEGTGEVRIEITCEHPLVILRVIDDGAGMSPEVQENAFEPFYTTKDEGDIGRGLGLATVYGIAKQIGGDAYARSESGNGTTMTVALPLLATEEVEVPEAEAAPPVQLLGHVLLIEDQAAVRDVLARQLVRLGCDVTTADGGDEAIELLAKGLKVDVVLSDVVMPGLQGAALVEALRAQVPELPFVFVSGYMDGRRAHSDIAHLGFEVLAKPVDMNQLAHTLSRHLRVPVE